jgi:hypothetical protein
VKVFAHANDVVTVGLGLKKKDVERLKPDGIRLETRSHDDEEHAFLTLGLTHFTQCYVENFPPLSFGFNCAYLGICIQDPRGESSIYVKRIFAPRLQALLIGWGFGFPTSSMSLDFPTRAHVGGEYRWSLKGDGAGVLTGKIEGGQSVSGRLEKFFDDHDSMVDFFWNRERLYTGQPDSLTKLNVEFSKPEYHPVIFEKLELGFLASDMERNRFPEAVLGSFFVPDVDLTLTTDETR